MRLTTSRCLLRDFQPHDVRDVHEYASDPEVCRYTNWGPNTLEDTHAFMKEALEMQTQNPRKEYTLAIEIKETGAVIGACNLTVNGLQGEIGYTVNRRYWGSGYATEVAQAMLAFAFQELGLHRIQATCRPANVQSARVLEKIGMRREGHLREHWFFKGKWNDSFIYAVLAYEFADDPLHNQMTEN